MPALCVSAMGNLQLRQVRACMTGWRSAGTLSFEVRLSRLTASEHKTDNRAVLIVGSIHDDALLAHESFTMEHFPSPLVLSLSTRTAPAGLVSPYLLDSNALKKDNVS